MFEEVVSKRRYSEPIYETDDETDEAEEVSYGGAKAPYCTVVTRTGIRTPFWLERTLDKNYNMHLTSPDNIPSPFIRASGWLMLALSQQWDKIVLKEQEEDVLNILRVVEPDVQRINFVGEDNGTSRRIPIVRTAEMREPVPLRSLGEGMNRLFGIALALTAARDGILLIDEIETGLHYSVMPNVWKLIFQVAERLNVQVFATTHSWDCIEAFQQAAAQDRNEEAVLIRLENRNGSVTATLFDERKLDIATRELIEVR